MYIILYNNRYYPNILPITRQAQIASELPRKSYASVTYSDKKQLEFTLDLTAGTYTNYSTMKICIPIQFTKKSNKAAQMDANMITVNNFFGHWFTDIDIRWYPDDMMILLTSNSVSIANYSNAEMKHLPIKSVKKLLKTMLYYNIAVVYNDDNIDRRSHDSTTNADRTDPNLNYWITNLRNFIFKKNVYRVPLTFITDLEKCNFTVKIGTKIILTLERNLNRLLELNKKERTIPTDPEALITFNDRPYISYQEITLTKRSDLYRNFKIRNRFKARCFRFAMSARVWNC